MKVLPAMATPPLNAITFSSLRLRATWRTPAIPSRSCSPKSNGATTPPTGAEMVYLLHFSKPYKHARHYLGSADDVSARLELHRKGQGARLTQVAVDAG